MIERWFIGCLVALFRLVSSGPCRGEFAAELRDDQRATFEIQLRSHWRESGPLAALGFALRNIVATGLATAADWARSVPTRWTIGTTGQRGDTERWIGIGASSLRQLRQSCRALARAPGFSITVIATTALGIGATTAIYSLVQSILLDPLPFRESHRLVQVFQQNSPENRWPLSVVDWNAISDSHDSFESVSAIRLTGATLTGHGEPQRILAGYASAGFAETFGIVPIEGRAFRPADGQAGAPATAIIARELRDRLWGYETEVVGRTVTIDGLPHVVLGVIDQRFEWLAGGRAIEAWPILRLEEPVRRGPFFLRVFGRLESHATLESAAAELAATSSAIFPTWQDGFGDRQARLTPYPLKSVIVGDVADELWLLFAAVGLVWLVSVVNVVNLLLARASRRARETALRASLGASRGRLVGQFLSESLVLVGAGAICGALLAAAAIGALAAAGTDLPRIGELSVDWRVLSFTVLLALVNGVVFGLTPLAGDVTARPGAALSAGGRSGTEGPGRRTLRNLLVSTEFALSIPLVVVATLLVASLMMLQRADPGFEVGRLVSGRLSLPVRDYPEMTDVRGFWRSALARLNELNEIESAAISSSLPPNEPGSINNFDLIANPVPVGASQPTAPWGSVSPQYFSTLNIPLIAGRVFTLRDTVEPVLVVSRSWAERHFPEGSAIGQRLHAGGCTSCEPYTVIGVVGDVAYQGLSGGGQAVYEPFDGWTQRTVSLIVRPSGSVADAVTAARGELARLDPSLPLARVETMEMRLGNSVAQPRLWAWLAGLFAVSAGALAAVGIYGVMSYSVSSRRREVAVRMALGAGRARVYRLIVGGGMRQAAYGVVIGLALAWLASGLVAHLLFRVPAKSGLVFALVPLAMLVTAAIACLLPAHRAARQDPAEVLEAD